MKKEYTITSNQDNLKISVLEYVPEHPKAIVMLSHGMCEYKERYEDFMQYFSKNNFICCINDHRGHGKSVLSNEDLGYFYDDTGEYIVEDLHQIINHLKDEYPNLPIYLLGHSMGSLVARKYLKKYDDDLTKLVVCGSPSENNLTGLAIALTKLIGLFKGDHYRSKLLEKISFDSYDKAFNDGVKNSWVNSNLEEVKKYNDDEKCGYIFTVNGFLNLFKLYKDTYNSKDWHTKNQELKILFIAGEQDPAIINKSAWLNSMTFLREMGYQNIEHILYAGDRHEVLNETNKEEVYRDVLKFFNE